MCALRLKVGTRNGKIISHVKRGDEVIAATVHFAKNDRLGLPEISVEISREDIWELVPFGEKDVANNVRVTPIGSIDANLLYGPYRIVGQRKDLRFVPSPFTGRWDGDDLIFHLRHMGFGTDHRVRAIQLRHVPGVLSGQCKDVYFNESGSFSVAS